MAQWYEYDWPLDGREAHFAVDLSLSDMDSETYPLLVYVSCAPKKKGARAFSALESSLAEGLCKRIEKRLSPVYAGFIEIRAKRQFYFYFADASALPELERIAEKQPMLNVRISSVDEPEWITYRSLLYPDAAKLQTERNRDHIEFMRSHGDAVMGSRRVTFSLFFATEVIMLRFSEQARLSGFAVEGPVFDPDSELAYGVKLVCISSIRKRDIDGLTTRAIRIAETYGGELRSWDAPLVKRGNPILGNQ